VKLLRLLDDGCHVVCLGKTSVGDVAESEV
jgi:hypothetical protein